MEVEETLSQLHWMSDVKDEMPDDATFLGSSCQRHKTDITSRRTEVLIAPVAVAASIMKRKTVMEI